ncbi:MAG: hypothetical protein HQK65_11200 [Desulfamplus sp.]|nr:hypothetical protein [Desulfamplus sp.]
MLLIDTDGMTTPQKKKHIFSKWSTKNGKGPKVVEAVESARDIVSSRMFIFFTFACFPVLLISLGRTFETGWQPIFYLHILLYCIMAVIALLRHFLSITFRATSMLFILLTLGLADLLQYGLCGLGIVFLSIFCLNTPIMFGKKWGVIALSISLFAIVLTAMLAVSGTLVFTFDIARYFAAPTSWLTAISVFCIFVTMPTLGMAKANEKQLNTIDALEQSETLHRNLLVEYKQAEEERKKIAAQLRQSQKMEAIGTLAGGIAHDFNNILSAVIGYSEMALYQVEEGSIVENNLQQINIAGKRAQELVKQILTFARKTEETMAPVNVGCIAQEVLTLLRSSLPIYTKLNINIQNQLSVMGNPTQLHQIFMNLCTNAFHAIKKTGGVVDVEVSDVITNTTTKTPGALFNTNEFLPPTGDYVMIKISDTGVGISPEIIPLIFEPYFTTKEIGKGTGMGLSVVHGIVKKHGGEIKVQSESGKGSTFTVFLPAINCDCIISSDIPN